MKPYLLTVGLCFFAGALMLLPADVHQLLYLDFQQLSLSSPAGLVTGHWIHADAQHLLWNVAGLGVLAAIIEARSRAVLLWSIVAGMVSVDLLLVSPFSDLQRYCGLSGLLNTLLGVAIWIKWQDTRSPWVVALAMAAVLKIGFELYSGKSVFTDISWPPYAAAHLAGLLGAALAIGLSGLANTKLFLTDNIKRSGDGNLVTSA